MKFKFSKDLDYQLEAVQAVVGIFDTGKNFLQQENLFQLQSQVGVVANEIEIDHDKIQKNLHATQRRYGLELSPIGGGTGIEKTGVGMIGVGASSGLVYKNDFSVEMETGTGKTYVYLRTVLELHQQYGLRKFIILVPSVAIREGVLKTLEQTREHFRELYGTPFSYFGYDSSRLSQVREFAQSIDIQIMVMTIQAFNSDDRVMRQTPDRFHGESPISLVSATRPVVIMDEPQNMESELSRSAIEDLAPLFKLRYSATHREIRNLVYRLTPVEAYKKGLVKKIAVFGVKENSSQDMIFGVRSIETRKGESPKARVMLEVKNAEESFIRKEMILKMGDDLVRKTKNERYHGLQVNDVDARHLRVELSDGKYYKVDEEKENKEAIFRTQIRETIKTHLDKQEEVGETLKVLSLFFIDKVANYIHEESLIRQIFVEEFGRLQGNYPRFAGQDVTTVHKGYFASKKEKGQQVFQDTKGDSKVDKEAYDLIMKEKERLLSFEEPVCFIFSHSALKEGWDNPNIFQICTLRETTSLMKKRQEIGRGLRLPVNTTGDRIYDPRINILTVIANESYEEYVAQLQEEFIEAGYSGKVEMTNAKEGKIIVKARKYIEEEDFKTLWEKIGKRTRYNLSVQTAGLIEKAVTEINKRDIKNLVVTVERVDIFFDSKDKMQTVYSGQSAGVRLERKFRLHNVVDRIARESELTKKTVFEVFSRVENLDILFQNPEEYIRSVVMILRGVLSDILLNDGLKYTPTGDMWEIRLLFKDFEALPSKSIPSERSAFDRVVFDSIGEKLFAESLEQSQNVKVYTKLPRGFVIDTPLGGYNPDWAIVWKTNEGKKLYLVRETKFDYGNLVAELSLAEQQKIFCGEKHFQAIGFDNFKIAEEQDLRDLL